MSHFNEHTLEMAIMKLFEQQGYSYVNGETIHKEQTEVLLRDDLRMYLMDRYADEGITPLEVERVMAKLTADNGAPLYEQNAQTYRLMTEGFAIKREIRSIDLGCNPNILLNIDIVYSSSIIIFPISYFALPQSKPPSLLANNRMCTNPRALP